MTDDTRSLLQRTQDKLAEPTLAEDIIMHVTNGGSLIELCRLWNIRYGDVNIWVYANIKERYEQALKASGEYLIQMVRDQLKTLGTLDLREAYDENGKLKDPKEWPHSLAQAISSVETDELFEGTGQDRVRIGDTKKLKLFDKLKALELLGRNLSMFIERHEVSGKVTLEDLLTASRTPAVPVHHDSSGQAPK